MLTGPDLTLTEAAGATGGCFPATLRLRQACLLHQFHHVCCHGNLLTRTYRHKCIYVVLFLIYNVHTNTNVYMWYCTIYYVVLFLIYDVVGHQVSFFLIPLDSTFLTNHIGIF